MEDRFYKFKGYLGRNQGYDYSVCLGEIKNSKMRDCFGIDKHTSVVYFRAKHDLLYKTKTQAYKVKRGDYSGPFVLSHDPQVVAKQLNALTYLAQNQHGHKPKQNFIWLDLASTMQGSFSVPTDNTLLNDSRIYCANDNLKTIRQKTNLNGYNDINRSLLKHVQIGSPDHPSQNHGHIYGSYLNNVNMLGSAKMQIIGSLLNKSLVNGKNYINSSKISGVRLDNLNNILNSTVKPGDRVTSPVTFSNCKIDNAHVYPNSSYTFNHQIMTGTKDHKAIITNPNDKNVKPDNNRRFKADTALGTKLS